MLKQPTTVNWVEKPGNPNFLIPVEVIGPDQPSGNDNNAPPPPAPLPKKGFEEYAVPLTSDKKGKYNWEQKEYVIGEMLYEAMTPLYQFIGMVEAESGKTMWYRFSAEKDLKARMIPINWGSKNVEGFRATNGHLGKEILDLILPKDPQFDLNGEELIGYRDPIVWQRATGQNLNRNQLEQAIKEVWRLVNDPVFQFILSSATYGALILAANELNLPLKPLIASPEVNYMFAQFVAKKFVAPKSNAYPSGMQGGQMVYRISSGFNTSSMANGKWLMGCREWFKGVFLGNDGVLRVGTGAPGSYSQQKRIDSPYSLAIQNARRQKEITRPPAPQGTQRILIQVNDEFGKIYGSFPIYVNSLTNLILDEIRDKIVREHEAFAGKRWTKMVYNGQPLVGQTVTVTRENDLISVEE